MEVRISHMGKSTASRRSLPLGLKQVQSQRAEHVESRVTHNMIVKVGKSSRR